MSIAALLNEVPHPGEFIRDELESRGWAQRDLAYILGVKEQAINPIMSGKRGISPDMAQSLSKAFGISAEYFLNLQKAYELSTARAADPAIERRAKLQSVFPIREMIKRNWFEETQDVSLLEAQVMRFFQTNSLDQVPCLAHNAKKGGDYSETTPLQWAWLYRVNQIAAEVVVPAYSEAKLENALRELERFLVEPEEIRHVPRVLSDAGIRFVVVETLPNANIDGVCFWLDKKSPVIGMTCRQDRIDNFWFVLRHEIEHLLNKDGQEDQLSSEIVDVDIDPEAAGLPQSEILANQAASQFCADQGTLDSFILRKYPYMSERDTLGLARRLQRHPGIVVGQLQYKMERQYKENRYKWLAKHKVKIRHFLNGNVIMDGWGEPAPVSL
ncbi:HigA family addiction module antitoxin [uncultured Sneathiella sp.]|jgi:HTH-type transcriptional regulator/antitoxin HigA|uniref:HigA family addiction module antitoxin n=1 Tax=uncultured Sneathiella sp. TaxID=879315 RepID=UPI0030D8B471|tara:strand:+ start:1912 stop:3066 length:1155 start_codon:yes stop_codon:yes gene_type:complete